MILLRCIALLQDPTLEHSFRSCLSQGALSDAALIFQAHTSSMSEGTISHGDFALNDIVRSLQSGVPSTVPATHICAFVKVVCLPLIIPSQIPVLSSPGQATTTKPRPSLHALALAAELCKRALRIEASLQPGSYVFASQIVSLALKVVGAEPLSGAWVVQSNAGKPVSDGMGPAGVAITRVQQLYQQLQTLSNVRASSVNNEAPSAASASASASAFDGLQKSVTTSLKDVIALGINGIIRNRLWDSRYTAVHSTQHSTCPDIDPDFDESSEVVKAFVEEVQGGIRPILVRCGVNPDDVLSEWIQLSIQQCIVVVRQAQSEESVDTDIDTNDDKKLRESAYYNSKSVDSELNNSNRSVELWKLVVAAKSIVDLKERSQVILQLLQVPVLALSCTATGGVTKLLCELAHQSLHAAPQATKDALVEAIRLQHIRSVLIPPSCCHVVP